MSVLTVKVPTLAGVSATGAAAASGGDSFANTGVEFVHIRNAHATLSRTVTFDSPTTCSLGIAANAAHDNAVAVSALSEVLIGPFSVPRFNDSNGRVVMTYSSEADLTVAVYKPA